MAEGPGVGGNTPISSGDGDNSVPEKYPPDESKDWTRCISRLALRPEVGLIPVNGMAEDIVPLDGTEVSMCGTLGGVRFGRLERVGSRPNSSSHLWAERFDAWSSVFIHSCDAVSDGAERV